MISMRRCLASASLALMVMAAPASVALLPAPAAASEIKVIVNNIPITTYDIQRRAAFLKLQRRSGSLSALAETAMIDQTLQIAEAQRLGIKVSDEQVDAAYSNFAKSQQDAGQAARRHHEPERRDQGSFQGIHPRADAVEPGSQQAQSQRIDHDRTGRGAKDAAAGRREAERDRIHAPAGDLRRPGERAERIAAAQERGRRDARAFHRLRQHAGIRQGPDRRDGQGSRPEACAGTAGRLGRADQEHQGRRHDAGARDGLSASNSSASAQAARFPTIAWPS